MKILRIIHTGDLHLGSLFTATPEVSAERRQDQMTTLRNIVEMCPQQKADVLLITGDLFDSLKVEEQLLSEVKDILGKCSARVFITPGNHDPATPDSCYLNSEWPENVYIFKGALECVEVEGKNACIWGAAFNRSYQLESLLTEFKPDDKQMNVLMLHGDLVADAQGESRYDPIPVDRLGSLGVEYVALGHVHKPDVKKVGDFQFGYCGVPEGRGFDEQGERGVYAGYIGKGFSHMEFVPTCLRRYMSESIDVSGCKVVSEFADRICKTLEKRCGEGYARNLYDITLRGELARGVMADSRAIREALREQLHFVRVTDTTSTELDIDMLGKDTTLRGAFARAVSARMLGDDKNRDKYLRALLYGLRAFDGEVRVNEDI